jgi:methionine-rich copper-binding protein CopC
VRAHVLAAVAAAVVLGAIAVVATPRVALAHAEPERSNPAAESVIPEAPDTVEIWFTQELFRREGANTIAVEGPNGRVDNGELVLDDADREHLSVGLQPDLPPGEYRVRWTSLSAIDGDAAEGEFTFTIDPTAPEPTPGTPGTPGTPEASPTSEATASSTATALASPVPTATPGTGDRDSNSGGSFPTWVLVAAAAILGFAALGAWALLRGDPDLEG